VWEEGRWSGSRVTRFSVFACLLLVAVDLGVSADLGGIFDGGFIVLCVAMALAIRPQDFFHVGVLPPMLLLGLCFILSIVDRGAIAPNGDSLVQAIISGLAHHSGPLLAGYGLALVVLAIRARVIRRHEAVLEDEEDYSNLEASPAPYRVTSAAPEVKSTTVVGNDPDSPSMTASST
jgi:hypothetical protein